MCGGGALSRRLDLPSYRQPQLLHWTDRFRRRSAGFRERSGSHLVSTGKVMLVVLATLVIFSTGLITGVVLVNQITPAPARPAALPQGGPAPGWPQFFHRIKTELDLTPQQEQRVSAI